MCIVNNKEYVMGAYASAINRCWYAIAIGITIYALLDLVLGLYNLGFNPWAAARDAANLLTTTPAYSWEEMKWRHSAVDAQYALADNFTFKVKVIIFTLPGAVAIRYIVQWIMTGRLK
jgi:hypothetical protein